MPADKTDTRLKWSAIGAAGASGLAYGLSVVCEKGSKGLKEIRSFGNVKELKEFLNHAKPDERVAITGSIWSDESIRNHIDGKSSVANKVVHAEIISTRTEGGIRPGERLLNSSRRAAPMFLKWDSNKVHLMPKDLKDLEPVLEHAGTLHKDAKFNPLRSIIEGYANNSFVIRQEEREYVLPLGTQITAVGQIAHRGRDFAVSPHKGHLQLSRDSLEQQMRQLDSWSSTFRLAAISCVVLSSAIMGGLLTYRLVKWWKGRQARKEEQKFLDRAKARRRAQGMASPQRSEAQDPSQRNGPWECTICMESGDGCGKAVFPACGHVAVCMNCAGHLSSCPLCRKRSNPRRIYM